MVVGLAIAAVSLGVFLWSLAEIVSGTGLTRKQRWTGMGFAVVVSVGFGAVVAELLEQVLP
jgi:hypothetical protein